MRVAIDVSPLETGHQFRGVGFYTKRLVKALKEFDRENEYILSTGRQPPATSDLVHYPYFDLFFLTLPMKKIAPTVVTIHDVIPLIFPEKYPKGIKGWLKFQIQKFSLKGAKAVITDSQNSKKDIIKYLGFPKEKSYVIPLAAGEEFKPLAKTRRKYSLPERFVLYVGDINWNKNIPGLVRACEKAKIPLVIVGKQAVSQDYDRAHPENQDLVWLQKKIEENPLLTALGFVSTQDLVAIYNLASVYCQPSFYEGFCLPVLEAMACGTPVVCSQTSSLPEVVGEAAVLVDPSNADDVYRGIKRLIEDEKLSDSLRQKGLQQARRFSWQKTARETINVYKKVLAAAS